MLCIYIGMTNPQISVPQLWNQEAETISDVSESLGKPTQSLN